MYFVYKLRLLTAETNPNFLRIDQFLCDLQPKKNTQTDRQTCRMATELTMVPK